MAAVGAEPASSVGVLGVTQYAPASLATYNTTTAPMAAIDTTNLTVSVTVPTNGKLLVRFSASMKGNGGSLCLGLLNHSGGAQIGNTVDITAAADVNLFVCEWYLTGLTAGALGIDVAFGVNSGTGTVFAQGYTGNASGVNAGPALLTVMSTV